MPHNTSFFLQLYFFFQRFIVILSNCIPYCQFLVCSFLWFLSFYFLESKTNEVILRKSLCVHPCLWIYQNCCLVPWNCFGFIIADPDAYGLKFVGQRSLPSRHKVPWSNPGADESFCDLLLRQS